MHAWLPWLAVVMTSSIAWAQVEKAEADGQTPATESPSEAAEAEAAEPAEAVEATKAVEATDPPPPAAQEAQTIDSADRGAPYNLQLGIGLGQQYAGLGASVSAYARVSGAWSLGAFASGGLADVEDCCSEWGYAAGLLAAWGWEDRLALAVSYGAVWNEGDTIDYGITVAAGYELQSRHGFWMRWLVGVAASLDTKRDAIPSVNLGLGWSL